jgi:heterodisulfide reductase subunit B
MERLIQSLGAEATSFPLRTRCCGGSLIISEEDLALELIRKLLENASSSGAQCIVTVCPMCQTNLDVYQSRVNRKFRTKFNLPVLFFTQLMGVAFGTEDKALGLGSGIIPADRVLATYTRK